MANQSRIPNIKLDDQRAEQVVRAIKSQLDSTKRTIDLEFTTTSLGPILISPDGSRWKLSVSDLGALVITAL